MTSLEDKILLAQIRIRQWHDYWKGEIYVSFSGGLDSTVLLHLVREIYPDVPGVFADTGLEYPEIRDFVKTKNNITWLRPFMSFKKVIEVHGYPIVSKKIAHRIRIMQENKPTTKATRHFYKTGQKSDGSFNIQAKIPEKWKKLIYAPFKISEECCNELKIGPLHKYEKQTGQYPFVGLRHAEGGQRQSLVDKHCNIFDSPHPKSIPLIKWSDADIRQYIKINKLTYSTIYDKGLNRTGCMFCMFGAHLDEGENRFQRMAKTHPRQYRTCMDTLGLREVLIYGGINPDPIQQRKGFFDKDNE